MSELEARLAALLEQETPGRVPPFADVRRRAVRRSRGRAAAAATAAMVGVAGAGGVAVHGWPDLGPPDRSVTAALPVDGPPPARITHQGVALSLAREVEVHSVQVDRVDRSTVTVEAGYAAPAVTWCDPLPLVRILGQDRHTVRLAAYEYKPVAPVPAGAACALPGRPWKKHLLHLGLPVDGRTVVNGQRTLPVHDPATLLAPTALPPGYAMPGELSWELPRRSAGPARYAQHTYYRGADFVYVRQADPAAEQILNTTGGQTSVFAPEELFGVEAHPTVRGQGGVVFLYGPQLRCVRWRESPSLAVVICSHSMNGPLPAADLLGMAESLRVGG